MRAFLASFAILALGVSAAHANLLVNGSFEQPGVAPYSITNPIPGWTASVDSIETGLGSLYGVTGYTGNFVCELDANANATIYQSFNLSTAHTVYLSFDYAHRFDAQPLNDGNFDVYFNSVLIGSYNPTSTAMTSVNLAVAGVAGANTLTFVATGTSDSYDGIIDNVSAAVPGPGAFASFGVAALGMLRRKRRA